MADQHSNSSDAIDLAMGGGSLSSTWSGTLTPLPATASTASATSPHISRPSLAPCPQEILAIIASSLRFHDLKSFRLVSKKFAAPGARNFFGGQRLSIVETPQSLARLINISTSPNLETAVRLIKKFAIWTYGMQIRFQSHKRKRRLG